jgi:ACS family tartrate transporter-like MFS transporter
MEGTALSQTGQPHDVVQALGRERPPESDPLGRTVLRKVMLRILPFCFLVFAISFIDRANVSYAALAMGRDLALSGEAFGFAAGVFFLGYLLCEVPSNAALRRFGARVWLARIQLTWGVVACASAFVQSAHQLYLARFLLGVAEAGLVPGLIAYFNYWFPIRRLARTGALLGAAVPVAYMASGPLSTWIMEHVSVFGLTGWRSMLFVEGLPALVTGAATYFVLTERPRDAAWPPRPTGCRGTGGAAAVGRERTALPGQFVVAVRD